LFPSSWTDAFEIKRGRAPATLPAELHISNLLHARAEYKAQVEVLKKALKGVVPIFERSTEDGTRFRIYRLGSLELRTSQDYAENETVCAVYSVLAPRMDKGGRYGCIVKEQERVIKVTEYVERGDLNTSCAHWQSYLVLETDQGNVVMTEQLANGAMQWKENPATLELRCSFAKVFRCADCQKVGITLGDIKGLQASTTQVFNKATGGRIVADVDAATQAWNAKYMPWVNQQRFLQALHGWVLKGGVRKCELASA